MTLSDQQLRSVKLAFADSWMTGLPSHRFVLVEMHVMCTAHWNEGYMRVFKLHCQPLSVKCSFVEKIVGPSMRLVHRNRFFIDVD